MEIKLNDKQAVEKEVYIYIGSYKFKEVTIDGKNKKGNNNYIRVKCPYCGQEYDISKSSFNKKPYCPKCCKNYENSFAYHVQVELGESLNKYWDWGKNEVNPYCIYKGSRRKIWIKCDKKDYHGSYEIICYSFLHGGRCNYCNRNSGKVHPKDSFGQWLIDTYGDDAIERYWSPKNTLDPFKISKGSDKKVWIKCRINYEHDDYLIRCRHFIHNRRCPKCNQSKGETLIFEVLTKDLNLKYNIDFICQKKFNNLIGVNGGLLSYDFYLPKYNLLIEFQGEQHEHFCKGVHKTHNKFENQLEHDRRKFNYAIKNNIDIIYVYYWEDNLKEKIKYELCQYNQ